MLAYLLAVPELSARVALLGATGHAYWTAAIAAASVLGLASMAATVLRQFRAGLRRDRPRLAPRPGAWPPTWPVCRSRSTWSKRCWSGWRRASRSGPCWMADSWSSGWSSRWPSPSAWRCCWHICVAILRTEAGRDPHDKELQNLVGELSTRSDEFRKRWGAHNVRHHGSGAKTYHHPIVGELTLAYGGLELATEPGLTLTINTAEPGSPSEEALRLLASWVASQETDPDAQTLSTERRHA
jgi:hypothetical protein